MEQLALACSPLLAIIIILGLFIGIGFVIDFDGMMGWYKEWKDRIEKWIGEENDNS